MIYTFEEFELDTDLYELRRQGSPLAVEPQVFDVLVYLVEHRDRVISKQELFENVWKTRFVTESALTSRIKAARRALGDDGRGQRMIGTVHGRGYRFLAAVEQRGDRRGPMAPEGGLRLPARRDSLFVGRETQLEALHGALEVALQGARRTVVVTGEAGAGKTTLIDAFTDEARRAHDLVVASGRCLEHQGPGEPYMPVLDALNRFCRSDGELRLLGILARQAPTWLLEMPWLVEEGQLEDLRRRIVGSTRSRMLREIVEALVAIADRRPLVFVIDDLQWSDPSTLDALNALARTRETSHLLILCSCRTSEFCDPNHRVGVLMHELMVHESCGELALPLLSEAQVEEFLQARLEGSILPKRAGRLVHARTEGNPLYMKTLVDDWMTRGVLGEKNGRAPGLNELSGEIPESLRRMIEQRFGRLSPRRQQIVEAAAVVGSESSAALIAEALGVQEEEIEEECGVLARTQRFLRPVAAQELDGAAPELFAFVHSIYQEVLYERVPAARRARLHAAIGQGLETIHGTRAGERAAELAFHFTRGRDARRAAIYRQAAAAQALRRYAFTEAIEHLEAGLRLLEELPSGTGTTLEVDLLDMLAISLIPVQGWSYPEIERCLVTALGLCKTLDDPARLSLLLYHLGVLYEFRGEHHKSEPLLGQRLELEAGTKDTTPLLESHELLACSAFHSGGFEQSLEHAEAGWSLYDPERHQDLIAATMGENLGVSCKAWGALDLWFLGYPDESVARMNEALELARDPAHSYSLSRAHEHAAVIHQLRREPETVLEHAAAALRLGAEQGYDFRIASSSMLRAWARVALGEPDEGLAELRANLDVYVAAGAWIDLPYFIGLLAEAWLRAGKTSQCLEAVNEALGVISARRYGYEAELHRLEGVARIQRGEHDEGRARLRRALDVAHSQGALSLELRAATSIARYTRNADEKEASHTLLLEVCSRLREGSKTFDLAEANRVLGRS